MKGYRQLTHNDELIDIPIFEVGDRVSLLKNAHSGAIDCPIEGTVFNIVDGCHGLFVDVIWDKDKYTSPDGGEITFGARRMAFNLELADKEGQKMWEWLNKYSCAKCGINEPFEDYDYCEDCMKQKFGR